MNRETLARRISRRNLWEMIDDIETIVLFKDDENFMRNLSCNKLDIFESLHGTQSFILWGAGNDGIRIAKLLHLLGKKITYWCDSKLEGDTFENETIVSPEYAFNHYMNETIIIASRKYSYEILNQILCFDKKHKEHIFDFDFIQAYGRYINEYRKSAVVSYPPLWMTIGVTSYCPNKCLFCSYHGNDAKNISNVYGLSYMLTLDEYKRMVDMAKSSNVPHIHICATGEPFINPDITDMIDYTIDKYGEVSLQTEFDKRIFQHKGYLDKLIERQKHITYITTDVFSSVPEEHERIKIGSSYKDFMESMEYIGANSDLLIKANVILTKKSYKNIIGILEDLKQRNVNCELELVNLLSYDYSEFTSSENVYTSKDTYITEELEKIKEYCLKENIKCIIPRPADSCDEECYVFWSEFQTWPVKGCRESHYVDNMIPHACAAVVRGELNSIGYLFDYENLMEAWNNKKLVNIRENILNNQYPSQWCKICCFYHEKDSIYLN